MKKTGKILLMFLVLVLVAAVFAACVEDTACKHEYVNGVCSKCGEKEPTGGDTTCEHNYVNGVCSKCGTACKHNFVNDVCTICNMADANAPHELVWAGLDEITIPVGDDYDVLAGVTVRDRKHGDLTSEIKVLTEEDEEELEALGVYEDFEEFNHNIAGAYTVYYKVTCKEDSKLSQVKSKDIVVSQLHNLANGDFAITNQSGFMNWNFDIPGASGATLEKYDDNGQIVPKFNFPSTTGNGWWSAQFHNTVNLVGGKTYRVAITAKSNSGKALAFGFEDKDNGYAMITGCTAFALEDTYQTYYSYVTPDKDYINAKAVLYLGYLLDADEVGESAHDVIVKRINIDIVDVCPEVQINVENVTLHADSEETKNFDPLAGVTASQGETNLTSQIKVAGAVPASVLEATNYTLCYYIPNENGKMALATRTVRVVLDKENVYDILNPDFDLGPFGDRYWTQDVNAGAGGSMTIKKVDDGIEITIGDQASADWHIQLRQDVNLVKGQIYDFEVRAKASVNRDMSVEFSGATKWGIQLTTEWQTFKYTYAGTGASNKRLSFLMGGGGSECRDSKIYIDYIHISLNPDQTQYEVFQLKNSSFANGTTFWSKEAADTFVKGTEEGRSSIVLTTGIHGEDWRSQLFQTGLDFAANKTYKVKAVLKADQSGIFRIEGNGLFDKKEWSLAANEETTCEFTVITTENKNGIRIGALMGELPEGTNLTFYTFEITLVEEAPETPAA